ncbi:zinc-dependent metalloprotease [Rothia sp. ZJ932]|uniref:zinc-dependent metalloprotease n=1 Tax=Rothia sp. ZJ932 TaxID=2810516 RepID=UPI0019685AF1|nr:zinc-dependent metalloprotease [Rothia sp. ZJ932]QRZ61748.1 zinc-dependent metalloprotease [Rothia sp. ZJ932]
MTLRRSPISRSTASKIAGFLAPAGPKLKGEDATKAVESMRAAADAAVEHVYAITRLEAAHNLRDSEVLIVDRASWAKANVQSFSVLLAPLASSPMGKKLESMSATEYKLATSAASAELGAILAFLSGKVLGQYDPYAQDAGVSDKVGRLMIVAPNLVALEKELNLEPEDFRLWVCLHEQTHRVQFAAAPWLKDYMLDQVRALTNEMGDSQKFMEQLVSSSRKARAELKGKKLADTAPPSRVFDQGFTEEGRARISHLTAIMSLMEGHANVVMDSVDRSIVPTVKTIRQRFERRSAAQKFLTKFIYSLLGMDAKKRQYRDGQKFVQYIVDERGMDAFNRIWTSPNTLPTEDEIHDPQAWIDRVLGQPKETSSNSAEA